MFGRLLKKKINNGQLCILVGYKTIGSYSPHNMLDFTQVIRF
jgi:hypothetical protein